MSNLCSRRNVLGSRIAAAIFFVASIGSTALASDCPLIAESCACQSDPAQVQPHPRQRPALKRASAKSATVGVSKPASIAQSRKPVATSSK